MFKVAYQVPDDGGCTYYRVLTPMQTCKRQAALGCKPIAKNDDLIKAAAVLKEAEIFLCSRIKDGQLIEVIEGFHKRGQKVVIDYDDDMFNVSPFSPFYDELGTKEIVVEHEGKPIYLWKDKAKFNNSDASVPFDIERNKKNLETIQKVVSAADLITVTTPELAEVYLQFNKNVRVLPNCVDLRIWGKRPFAERENVRIGWFGGSSHYEDWAMIAPAVQRFFKDHPYAQLVIMGQRFDATLRGISPTQIEHHPWVHTQAYPYAAQLLDLDFAIIPLKDTPFNRNKSPIKWIEMAAMEVPSVTSNIPPYSPVMDMVPDNGVFIDGEDADLWYEGMRTLYNDKELRRTIGKNARQTVAERFDINGEYVRWANAYKEVFSCQLPQSQPSPVSLAKG